MQQIYRNLRLWNQWHRFVYVFISASVFHYVSYLSVQGDKLVYRFEQMFQVYRLWSWLFSLLWSKMCCLVPPLQTSALLNLALKESVKNGESYFKRFLNKKWTLAIEGADLKINALMKLCAGRLFKKSCVPLLVNQGDLHSKSFIWLQETSAQFSHSSSLKNSRYCHHVMPTVWEIPFYVKTNSSNM